VLRFVEIGLVGHFGFKLKLIEIVFIILAKLKALWR